MYIPLLAACALLCSRAAAWGTLQGPPHDKNWHPLYKDIYIGPVDDRPHAQDLWWKACMQADPEGISYLRDGGRNYEMVVLSCYRENDTIDAMKTKIGKALSYVNRDPSRGNWVTF